MPIARSILLICAAGLLGCGPELETGYKYRPLNASATERRGFYASPYSPQKMAAEQERQQENKPHGPSLTP